MPFFPHPPSPLPHAGEGEFGRPDARRRRAHRRWRLSRSWSRVHDSGPRRRASPRRAEGVWSLSKYSSSHKDWACWAGLHPPSNADALCAIPPRTPRLCVHQTGSRGDAETRRRGERKRSAHKAGWTGLHPFPEAGASRGTACPDRGSTYLRTAIIRYAGLAVGLMEIENIIRYTERAVGLKPSARQGEACLRGLYRSISSKTIRPRLSKAKPACA